MKIRTYRPGDEAAQAALYNEAAAHLPRFKPAAEEEVRRQAAEVFGRPTTGWEVVRRDDVRHALPAQPPPLRVTSPARVGPGVYVAGDHRDTASIQGALVSGHRVASREEVAGVK